MATTEKRGNSYRIKVFCGYAADGKQVYVSKTWAPPEGMTENQIKKELERQKVLFEESVKHKGYASKKVKFEAAARDWLEQASREGNHKPQTLERLRQLQDRTYTAIGHLPLDRITTRIIQQFINNLAEDGINQQTGGGLSTKTQKLYLGFISDVFKYAIKNGLAIDNPCKNVSAIRKPPQERQMLTVEQASVFLAALDEAPTKYKTFFYLAIYGGFRRGEILGFEWSDIDFENNIITVNRTAIHENGKRATGTPKTNHSKRSLKLPDLVFQQLKVYRAEQLTGRFKMGDAWHDTNRVFTSWNGDPMGDNTANHWLKRFCASHGLPEVCIHSFRHLNASQLISLGTDAKTVSAALGHSDVSFTLKQYVHAFQEQQAKASEALAISFEAAKNA